MNEQEIRELRAKLLMEAADLLQVLDEWITVKDMPYRSCSERERKGKPYFKLEFYDNKKNKRLITYRLHFLDNGLEFHGLKNGRFELSNTDFKDIIKYLKSKSEQMSGKYTPWEILCYDWNKCNLNIKFFNIEDYLSGKFDKEMSGISEYVPSNTSIPNWAI